MIKKELIFVVGLWICPLIAGAQSLNISYGSVSYSFRAEGAGEMIFEGSNLKVGSRIFNLAEWSKMNVSEAVADNHTVAVIYDGDMATAVISGDIADYVEVSVDGANVAILQSDLVDETTGEITYILKGSSASGSLNLTGSYKSSIELQGLSLANPYGAALDIKNGKRISIIAKNGTVNYLEDGEGSQKGAINCTGHLEFKGKGTLTVKGNKSHAIYAKEYVEIKNLSLDITGSKKDGINCNQYFLMQSGTLQISNVGDDGIQVAYKDDVDREEEDTGSFMMTGGTMTITSSAEAAKAVKADGDVEISGGRLNLNSKGNGIWDSSKLKTKAAACIGADGNVNISGGELILRAEGSGGKGISCDGEFISDGGNYDILTVGGLLVYSNGSLNHNYSGNTDRITSDYKSSAKGIKADSGVIINSGEMKILTNTNNAEGIESKKDLSINGGTIFVKAYDDGINSSNEFNVSGGNLTVISIVGDGLDSNGNLRISGGRVMTMGSGGMEMGLDASTETGCAVYLTGGEVFAFGGNNTYPNKSGSTQAFVKGAGSVKADTKVAVMDGSITLIEFEIPSEYTPSTTTNPFFSNQKAPGGWKPGGNSGSGSILISSPDIVSGKTYTILNDATSSSVTATLTNSGR